MPLFILSILAIIFGYLAKDLIVNLGTDFLSTSLYQAPKTNAIVEAEFGLTIFIKLLPLIVSISGAFFAIIIYNLIPSFAVSFSRNVIGNIVYRYLINSWSFDHIIINFIIKPFLNSSHIISKVLDRGVIEIVGPFGLTTGLTNTAHVIAHYDTGLVTSYAVYIVLGILILVLYAFSNLVLGNDEDSSIILLMICSLALLPRTRQV